MEGVSTKNRMLSVRNLPFKKMAGATGLEPATSAVTGQRSNQLSYAPAKNGSQNVCRLPMNRQQVCDVFSKKKRLLCQKPMEGELRNPLLSWFCYKRPHLMPFMDCL